MSNVLHLETLVQENLDFTMQVKREIPEEITEAIENKRIASFPFFMREWLGKYILKPKVIKKIIPKVISETILISIPPASLAQNQVLTQKYMQFAQLVQLTFEAENLEPDSITKQLQLMLELIVVAIKPAKPDITEEFLTDNLTPEQIGELFAHISNPIQQKIIKNVNSLQGLQKK